MSTNSTHDRIMDRIQEGFWTPDQVLYCGECGHPIMELTIEQVKAEMDELVLEGKVEQRPQGKATDSPGNQIQIYVPAGTGFYNSNRPRGDENASDQPLVAMPRRGFRHGLEDEDNR